jgi:RNA polymerase primary sigma factor
MIARSMSYCSSAAECRAAPLGPIGRARRILGTKLGYIDHPSFDDPTVRDVILAPSPESVEDQVSHRLPPSRWRGPVTTGRSGALLLSREQEAHLFRKMNYLKYRANQLREQLDPDRPSPGQLDEIERHQSEALAVKDRIVQMNLRLVISIAKGHVRAGYSLAECVSDGNLALLQAVDKFDFARGNKFSTYATWVIRNTLARNEQSSTRPRRYPFASYEESLAGPDSGIDEYEREEVQDQRRSMVRRWLRRLDKRERRILASRYGIGGATEQTLTQIAQELGISKERVRQLATRAQNKLRMFARLEALEPLEM